MNKGIIDCFLVGHNEIDFTDYELSLRKLGVNSGNYNNLSLNFVWNNKEPYPINKLFNLLAHKAGLEDVKPLLINENFSLAIAYLGSHLNRNGHSFDYINSFQDEKEYLKEKLETGDVKSIAILSTFYVWEKPIIEIVNFIRNINENVKIIVGGPYIFNQSKVLDDSSLDFLFKSINADYYIDSHQGETTLSTLVNSIKNNLEVTEIPNLYFKKNDVFIKTASVQENNQLDENPVNWSFFKDRVTDYIAVRTAISCPFSCNFCSFPEFAGKYQNVKIENLENELNSINKLNRVKSIWFIDDSFNMPPKRFKEILRMIIRNNHTFKWFSYFRCQGYDEEMAQLMKESGCQGVFFGIESGNNQILENMNKKLQIETYYKAIEIFKKYDIVTYGSFILGFPGETLSSVEDTKIFLENSGLDFYQWKLWYNSPLAPIYKEHKDKYEIKGLYYEWKHNTMNAKEASELLLEKYIEVNNSIRVPDYGFDFPGIFHLMDRGLSITQVKNFLRSFNNAIKQKIINNPFMEIGEKGLQEIINSLSFDHNSFEQEGSCLSNEKIEIDFDL